MPLPCSGPISMSQIVAEYQVRLPANANAMAILRTNLHGHIGKGPIDPISFSDFVCTANYRIILPNNTFDVYTTYTATIPTTEILSGAIDEWSNNQDPLTLISVQNPIGGTVILNGTNVEFTSTGAVGAAASFEFTVRNSSNETETGTVTMNVVAIPPIIAVTDVYELRQAETLLINSTNLAANDIDGQGRSLTVTSVQNPTNGIVSLNGTTIEFISTGLSGQPAGFEYTVTNGTETQTGTVYINITPLPKLDAYMFNSTSATLDATDTIRPPTVADIFNTWSRFDGANYYAGDDPNMSSNASAWQLLANPDRVLMPLNVDPANGFISPDELTDYTLQATLTSTSGDNDTNGLVVAFVREGSTNHVLAVGTSKAGSSPRSGYALMYFQNTSGYSDEPTMLAQPSFGLSTAGGWSGSQIRIKIERQGDIIKTYASQFNNTGSYDIGSEIIFDLSSNANTQRFMGAKPYGYMTFSQPDSSYIDIEFGGGLDGDTLYDAENNDVYDWDEPSQTWILHPSDTIQDRLGYTRKIVNPDTTRRFLIKESEVLFLGTANGAVFSGTKVLNEQQNIVINSLAVVSGAPTSTQVVGLHEKDTEEVNLLAGQPTLSTTSGYSGGKNTVGSGTYFSDNNIDIVTRNLVGGTVVFNNGTVGSITAIDQSSISYTPTSDFTIYDETI